MTAQETTYEIGWIAGFSTPYLIKTNTTKTTIANLPAREDLRQKAKFDRHTGIFGSFSALDIDEFSPSPSKPQIKFGLQQGEFYYNPISCVHAQLIFIDYNKLFFYNPRTNTIHSVATGARDFNKITHTVERPLSLISWEPNINYRSASLIEVFNGKKASKERGAELFIIGDDQQFGIVLSDNFRPLRQFAITPPGPPVARIPKAEKHDIEAGAVQDGSLYVFSSGHRPKGGKENPNQCRVFDLMAYSTPEYANLDAEYDQMLELIEAKLGISVVNIEAAAFVGQRLVLGERETNTLLIFDAPPAKGFVPKLIFSIKIDLDGIYTAQVAYPSISSLCYLDKTDTLVFTCSTEFRNHPTLDGEYGDSLLGYIKGFKRGKMGYHIIKPTALYNISEFVPQAKSHKIEGCTGLWWGEQNGEDHLFLCSDNDDNATSAIFRIRFTEKNIAPTQ